MGDYTVDFTTISDLIYKGDKIMKVAPLTKKITGPKELKIIHIYNDIKNIFEKRLLEMNGDAVTQDDFIKSRTALSDCLNQLEKLRKRFVNNKQHRKTTHIQNRRLLRELQALLPPPIYSEFGGGFSLEEDLRNTHKSVIILKSMDDRSKEYHRSVASNILYDINSIVGDILPKITVNLFGN